jgi:hypothetical protein
VIPIENDIGKAAGKIEQIKVAFREAHETLSNFVYTTTSTDILGSTNIVQITQKVCLFHALAALAHYVL